jgi:predicted Zn-dependent protease
MKFDNPSVIDCPDCGQSSTFALAELVGLEASCPGCGHSFRELGLSMRRYANQQTRYFVVWEVVWMFEAKYGFSSDEREVAQLDTPRSLFDLLHGKSGGRATLEEVLEDLSLRIKRPVDASHLDDLLVDLIPDPVTGAS